MSDLFMEENTAESKHNFSELIPEQFRFFAVNKNNPADILEVFKFDRTQSEMFLQNIQFGGLQYINVSADNRKLIQQLYFDAQNQIKIKGKNNLTVAYPFFYDRDESDAIFSPLFFFQTDLEPETGSIDTWRFASARQNIFPNHHVFNFLEKKYGVEKNKIYDDLKNNTDFTAFLKNTSEHIAEKIGFYIEFSPNKIFPVQDAAGLQNELDDKGIFFNAIIGNFDLPTQKFVSFSYENIDNQEVKDVEKYHYGLFPNDVAQQNALVNITQKVNVFTGNAGTGKTHSIANLASFVISKGKKMLIINNNQKSLLQIQNALAKWNVDKFSFVLKDREVDKNVILEIMRAIGNSVDERQKAFNTKNFEVKTAALLNAQSKLAESYAHLSKQVPIAGNWQSLVAASLNSNAEVGKEILNSQLTASKFDFSEDEFLDLRFCLATGFHLYSPLQTLQHPLNNLHERLFKNTDATATLSEIQNKISTTKYDLVNLYSVGNQKIESYKQSRLNESKSQYLDFYSRAVKLKDSISEQSKLLGSTYKKPTFWHRIFGGFTKKGKEINTALADARGQYESLAKDFVAAKLFKFDFSKNDKIRPAKIENLLTAFIPKINDWDAETRNRVEAEAINLSSKNDFFQGEEQDFEEKLNHVLDEFNNAEIYKTPFGETSGIISSNLKAIDVCISKLNETEKQLNEYGIFHAWQTFWSGLDEKSIHLIKGCIASKTNNWENAFDSWYFDQLLQKNYSNNFPQNTDNQRDILKRQQEVLLDLPVQILASGQDLRYEMLQNYRKKSERFNAVFGKNNQVLTPDFETLFKNDFEAITACFPVLMTTPDFAMHTLATQQFDYVVFDDAQQISLHQCAGLLEKGKQNIIVGDPTEISDKHNSLLYWALQNNFKISELSMIHTTKSDAMNLFLDAIYPSDSIRLPIVNEKTQFIDIVNVMGRFDDANYTNSAEAEQVLTLLNTIEKTSLNKYPSVGIITTTIEQRNLISNILLQIKQKRSPGYDKILQFERNNLGVYHWSEIEGLKFDVVICGLTYGIKDSKGKLSEEIQGLNSTVGFGYLYQTLTRASERLIICNSIPYSYFDEFFESPTAKGTFLLSALFKYKNALTNENHNAQQSILEKVSEGLGSIKNQQMSELAQHIYISLKEKLENNGKNVIIMPQIGSITVPLVIQDDNEEIPTIALRIDGTFTLPYIPDSVWEASFEKQLTDNNYKIVDSWSASWWRNRDGEIERMLKVLEEVQKEFSPIPEETLSESLDIDVEESELEIVDNQLVVSEENEILEVDPQTDIAEIRETILEPERNYDDLTRPSEA